ncbi:MAG: MerR family transcriptional regulator [Desulfobacteraceae bacterium]
MAVDQLSLYQDIPDKLYFKVGEVAELTGVPSYVLRFWESEFPSIRPERTDSGQQLYRKSDVEIILTIKHLLHEKHFTIEGVKQYLLERPDIKQTELITEIDSHCSTDENIAKNDSETKTLIKEIYSELQQIRDLLD